MLGFIGIFGRSHELQRLDQAVRTVGLHPRLVPEAVKLTTLKLLKEADGGAGPAPRAYYAAAEMLGFCMLGPQGFTEANDLRLTEATEERLEAALKAGEYKKVVELSSAAYVELLKRKPEMLQGQEQFMNVIFFPRLGARLVLQNDGQPEIVWDRENFSFSEAVTYYEFTIDKLIKAGL